MAIEFTFHGKQRPRDGTGFVVTILNAQYGDAVILADGAITAALPAGLYQITATSDCRVRWGNIPDATGAMIWHTGRYDVVWLDDGEKIACGAV